MLNNVPALKSLRSTFSPGWIFMTDLDSLNNLNIGRILVLVVPADFIAEI